MKTTSNSGILILVLIDQPLEKPERHSKPERGCLSVSRESSRNIPEIVNQESEILQTKIGYPPRAEDLRIPGNDRPHDLS